MSTNHRKACFTPGNNSPRVDVDCVPVGLTAPDGSCSGSTASCCDVLCQLGGPCLFSTVRVDDDDFPSCKEGESCVARGACVLDGTEVTFPYDEKLEKTCNMAIP